MRRDRLTISRLMVLTAGICLSLALVAPRNFQVWPATVDPYRQMYSTLLVGLSLPGLIYCWPRHVRARQRLGSLLWLSLALGAWLLLPPAAVAPLVRGQELGNNMAVSCMYLLFPLMSVWLLLAGWLGGSLWPSVRASALWRERFGIWLGLAWCLQGLWILGEMYWDAFLQ
jgi:hypothetical protein